MSGLAALFKKANAKREYSPFLLHRADRARIIYMGR